MYYHTYYELKKIIGTTVIFVNQGFSIATLLGWVANQKILACKDDIVVVLLVLQVSFYLRIHMLEPCISTFYQFQCTEYWLESFFFQTEGPLYWTTMALHILTPAKWKEKRVKLLDRLMVMAQTRHVTPGGTKT